MSRTPLQKLQVEVLSSRRKIEELEKEVAHWKEKEFIACSKHHEFISEIERLEKENEQSKGLWEYYRDQHLASSKEARECAEERHNYQLWVVGSLNEQKQRISELEDQNQTLIEALGKSGMFIQAIMSFYGNGLLVANWHENGDLEPWDNFFDNNMDGDELEVIQKALQSIRKDESNGRS